MEPRFTATGAEGGDVAAGVGTGTAWRGDAGNGSPVSVGFEDEGAIECYV